MPTVSFLGFALIGIQVQASVTPDTENTWCHMKAVYICLHWLHVTKEMTWELMYQVPFDKIID